MRKIYLSTVLLFALSLSGLAQITKNPIKWQTKLEQIDGNTYEIILQGNISGHEWHIYDLGPYEYGPNPTTMLVESEGNIKLIDAPYIKSEVHKSYDDNFEMEIGYCVGNPVIAQKIKLLSNQATKVNVTVEWQMCNKGSCLPPTDQVLVVELPAHTDNQAVINAADSEEETTAISSSAHTDSQAEVSAVEDTTHIPSKGGLWGLILQAIAWGFIALLTPCVFPMVPMTVSFFLKNSQKEGATKQRGKFLASVFGLSIIALYTLPIAAIIVITYVVGGDAVTANIFNWLATHWIPNVLFFVIFMVFAASFFGAFEITMPSWLVNKSDSKSDKGGLIGVFFMALTLVLVSFSCTGPIVGTVLINSTQGEIWEPIITMLAFSAAFALPFTIFAFAPSLLKELPKSGGWLNSVKVVLGFLEVALGFKFLSVADQTYHWGILDREVYLAIWIVVFTLLGLYLLGKIRFEHDSPTEFISVKRLALAIAVFSFVVYMIPGMFGAPLKALSGYLPPLTSQDFVLSAGSGNTNVSKQHSEVIFGDFLHLPLGLNGYFEYNEALAAAKKQNKPLFVDFTGHGCVNCREMEVRVWSDPAVLQRLNDNFVIVALYVDDKTTVDEQYWVTTESGKVLKQLGKINAHFAKERYNVNAQPYYAIIDPNTEEHLTTPTGYNLNVSQFIQFLDSAVK